MVPLDPSIIVPIHSSVYICSQRFTPDIQHCILSNHPSIYPSIVYISQRWLNSNETVVSCRHHKHGTFYTRRNKFRTHTRIIPIVVKAEQRQPQSSRDKSTSHAPALDCRLWLKSFLDVTCLVLGDPFFYHSLLK